MTDLLKAVGVISWAHLAGIVGDSGQRAEMFRVGIGTPFSSTILFIRLLSPTHLSVFFDAFMSCHTLGCAEE